jgi:serine/threonine protein kinase
MAPELFAVHGEIAVAYDFKVDVFSFGVLLYELAKKGLPFENCSLVQLGVLVLKGERPSLDGLSDGVKSLITRCWAHNPKERPMMSQVVKELEGEAFMLPGVNALEFRQWVKRTAMEHRAAMQTAGRVASQI